MADVFTDGSSKKKILWSGSVAVSYTHLTLPTT